jgi:hypothetical protein
MVGGCSTLPVREPSREITKELDATVALYTQVETDDGDKVDWSYCSATWIDDKHILTAAHCVRGAAEQEAEKRNEEIPLELEGTQIEFIQRSEWNKDGIGTIHRAVATAVDEDLDLATLTAVLPESYEHVSIKVATQSPGQGEVVMSVGHPKQKRWTFVYGTVSNFSGNDIMINSAVFFGNSGGAIFSNGEIVGVCSRLTRIPQESLYVNVAAINRFLKRDCDGESCKL